MAAGGGLCQFPRALRAAAGAPAPTRCGVGSDHAAVDLFPGRGGGPVAPQPLLLLGHGFNPDEAIAAGWLRPGSFTARSLERMSRFSLRQAKKAIALDRSMRDRIVAKGIAPANVVVIPPWSHDTEVKFDPEGFDPEGRERFRQAHGLDGKFVVMYSGNHSSMHPLDTLLAAARRLAPDPGIVFCFIVGGSEWRKIKEECRSQEADCQNQRSEIRNQSLGFDPSSAREAPTFSVSLASRWNNWPRRYRHGVPAVKVWRWYGEGRLYSARIPLVQ